MKKFLYLCMVAAVMAAVSGCGGKQEPGTGEEVPGSGSQQEGQAQAGASGESEAQNGEAAAGSIRQEPEYTFTNLNKFQAAALDGSEFTQDDFADRDVTVINFWALTCGPCIAEMPDLAELEKALPDNVQLITVCLDGGGSEELVEYVLEESGFEGITLVWGDGDLVTLSSELRYTPTTVFVDSEGNMAGDVVVGGKENLSEFYTQRINDILTGMGKAEISIGTEEE